MGMGEEPHGRGMAWATLLVSGGISWGVNLWHAFDQADGRVGWRFAALATMYGTAPVILAAFQSHSAAFTPMGWRKRALTYLLVLLGMVLSVQAQAEAVHVFAGEWLRWVFPVFVDLSAFLALHTLMSSSGPVRSAARSTAVPDAVGVVPVRSSGAVPAGVPVRVDGPQTGPAEPVRTEPVPVRAAEQTGTQTGPVAEPVPADQTGTADRTAEAEPVRTEAEQTETGQTAGPDRPERTTSPVPDRALALAPSTTRPAEETPLEPALELTAEPEPVRPKATRRPKAKAPARPAAKGDAAALELLDAELGDADPATVSIGQVRRALGGAGFARGQRVHGLWVASRTGTGSADRTADRRTGTGRTGARTGAQTRPDRDGTADRTDEDEGADRSADRALVPA